MNPAKKVWKRSARTPQIPLLKGEMLKGLLDLIVLLSINRRKNYVYALIAELTKLTEGKMRLSDGTLYPSFKRLEEAGYLKHEQTVRDGRITKIYSLTREGEERLSQLLIEWEALRDIMDKLTELAHVSQDQHADN